MVGILALSGIPRLNALGTVGSAALTTVGSLILLAGLCLRCVKGNGTGDTTLQGTQNNGSNSVDGAVNQNVDHRPIFHRGETWLDELVNESTVYTAFKLIITVTTQGKVTSESHIVQCIPDVVVAVEELKLHVSQIFQRVSLFEKINPGVTVAFTLLTKSQGNKFGMHHLALELGGLFGIHVKTSMDSIDHEPGVNRDFAALFKLMGLKVAPQFDDAYNFI